MIKVIVFILLSFILFSSNTTPVEGPSELNDARKTFHSTTTLPIIHEKEQKINSIELLQHERRPRALMPEEKPSIKLSPGESLIDKVTAKTNAETVAKANFPIDIVSFWTDMSDVNVKSKFQELLSKETNIISQNQKIETEEIEGSETLRYFLRGVEKYAFPAIRKVHIITPDEQSLPKWLELNPKINLISHGDIFERAATDLPTFNQLAIEANIHRVPGLAEHFVYIPLNTMFSSSVSKSDFFTSDGKPIVRSISTKEHQQDFSMINQKTYYDSRTIENSDQVFEKYYEQQQSKNSFENENNKSPSGLLIQTKNLINNKSNWRNIVTPLLKSVLAKTEEKIESKLALTSHHKFLQSSSDISLFYLSLKINKFENKLLEEQWNDLDINFVGYQNNNNNNNNQIEKSLEKEGNERNSNNNNNFQEVEKEFSNVKIFAPKLFSIGMKETTKDNNQNEFLFKNLENILPVVSSFERKLQF